MSKKHEWRRVIPGGIFGGVVGAAAMVAVVVVVSVLRGHDLWASLKAAAAPLLGARAALPGLDAPALLAAFAIHVAVAIAWGVLFATVLDGQPRLTTALAGPVFGLIVWITMFYLVLPIFGLGAMARHTAPVSSMIEHAFYGVGVAVGYLPFQRPTTPRLVTPPRWRVPTTRHRHPG
ncbi:MAG: hypothetical protein JWM74_277 [Myxococcaceae bacterium]|jgi:hypothetical protein|nr:hypothetical protein [Myxococcaceae bacterium]